jgi:hypothetical protein
VAINESDRYIGYNTYMRLLTYLQVDRLDRELFTDSEAFIFGNKNTIL